MFVFSSKHVEYLVYLNHLLLGYLTLIEGLLDYRDRLFTSET